MKIIGIFVLCALAEIVAGNLWAAAARGLYKPIALSIGTVFTAIKMSDDQPMFEGTDWKRFFEKKYDKDDESGKSF